MTHSGRLSIDPRHLRVLREVDATQSFAGAARALGYTQPAIAQQIQTLEQRLSTPVIVRSGRKVVLTAVGRVLLQHGQQVLDLLDSLGDEVRYVRDGTSGRVRMMLSATPMQVLAPSVLTILREHRPGLRLQAMQAHSQTSVRALRGGETDVAVITRISHTEELIAAGLLSSSLLTVRGPELTGMLEVPLFVDSLVLLVPADHRLARQDSVRLDDVGTERVITGGTELDAEMPPSRGPSDQDTAIVATNVLAIRELVAAGHGVAVMGSTTAATFTQSDVRVLDFEPHITRTHSGVVWERLASVDAIRGTLDALVQAGSARMFAG